MSSHGRTGKTSPDSSTSAIEAPPVRSPTRRSVLSDQSELGRVLERAFCSVRVSRRWRGSAIRHLPGGRVDRTSMVDPRVHLSARDWVDDLSLLIPRPRIDSERTGCSDSLRGCSLRAEGAPNASLVVPDASAIDDPERRAHHVSDRRVTRAHQCRARAASKVCAASTASPATCRAPVQNAPSLS